jgi:WD40 repeat protein
MGGADRVHKPGYWSGVCRRRAASGLCRCYDGTARLWDTAEAREKTVMTNNGEIWDVSFSPDNQFLASVHSHHTVRLSDVFSGSLHAELTGHRN